MATTEELLRRITARPDVFGGKPIVRDLRVSVELGLRLLTQGMAPDALVDDYPGLERDDIRTCIAYAHASSRETRRLRFPCPRREMPSRPTDMLAAAKRSGSSGSAMTDTTCSKLGHSVLILETESCWNSRIQLTVS